MYVFGIKMYQFPYRDDFVNQKRQTNSAISGRVFLNDWCTFQKEKKSKKKMDVYLQNEVMNKKEWGDSEEKQNEGTALNPVCPSTRGTFRAPF